MDWPACRWFAFIAHALNALTVFMHVYCNLFAYLNSHIWLRRIAVKHQILLRTILGLKMSLL